MNRLKLTDFAPKNTFWSKLRFLFRAARNWFIIGTAAVFLPPSRQKNWWLRRTGAKIDPAAFIAPLVFIEPMESHRIDLGKNTVIGQRCLIMAHLIRPWKIENVPENTIFGKWYNDIEIWGQSKYIKINENTIFRLDLADTSILDGAMIGAFSDCQPGVVVGKNSVVGAHSTVFIGTEIPDRELWTGTPAKFKKKL